MNTIVTRLHTALLLVLGVIVSSINLAQAEPIRNPQNCSGPVTIGVATCGDTPGHWVECIPSGDYMCCTANAQGGKDCEQIEAFKGPKGGNLRVPGGVLQNAPVTSPSSPPRFPKAGMNAPIMRRGVEPGTPENSTADPSTSAPENK
jgi:hypothetical protein